MVTLSAESGEELLALLRSAVDELPPVSATGDDTQADTLPSWPASSTVEESTRLLGGAFLRLKQGAPFAEEVAVVVPTAPVEHEDGVMRIRVVPTLLARQFQPASFFDDYVESFMPHAISEASRTTLETGTGAEFVLGSLRAFVTMSAEDAAESSVTVRIPSAGASRKVSVKDALSRLHVSWVPWVPRAMATAWVVAPQFLILEILIHVALSTWATLGAGSPSEAAVAAAQFLVALLPSLSTTPSLLQASDSYTKGQMMGALQPLAGFTTALVSLPARSPRVRAELGRAAEVAATLLQPASSLSDRLTPPTRSASFSRWAR